MWAAMSAAEREEFLAGVHVLDVPERHPGVEGGGDERVPQRVRPDRLGDPGAARDSADDPRDTVPV